MPVKIYHCDQCEWTGKRLSKEVVKCPECEAELILDEIETLKAGANFDRVPGGYDSNILTQKRLSDDGQMQEAAYLAGDAKAAY
jgi:hypothetical protein